MLSSTWFFAATDADGSGELYHGLELVEKYRKALSRQHRLVFTAWRAKDFTQALAQLHFMLVSLDRMNDGLAIVARKLGGDVGKFIATKDFGDYQDARNHFEHLDDRLFGTKRNAPESITEGGATRTVHYDLSSKNDQRFSWGKKSIDISERFLADYIDYVATAHELTKVALKL